MKTNHATIASLLQQATTTLDAASDTPQLDAQVIMAHCLKRDRSYLFAWPERSLTHEQQTQFHQLVEHRATQIPLAQLTGHREFWSLDFNVTHNTLIPRPDTELLVELALDALKKHPGPVLDLGTGSGVIAISIAHEIPGIRVDAIDNSDEALAVARGNATKHQTPVNFVLSHWFDNVSARDYQLIVSNPPYLATDDAHLHKDGLQFEPQTALVAESNGLAAIKTIVENAANYCNNEASILIEHGHTQGADVRALMRAQGFHRVSTHQDIERRERVTLATITK